MLGVLLHWTSCFLTHTSLSRQSSQRPAHELLGHSHGPQRCPRKCIHETDVVSRSRSVDLMNTKPGFNLFARISHFWPVLLSANCGLSDTIVWICQPTRNPGRPLFKSCIPFPPDMLSCGVIIYPILILYIETSQRVHGSCEWSVFVLICAVYHPWLH